MSAANPWQCANPCGKIFRCQRDLSLHCAYNPDCLERFESFLLSLDPAFSPPSSGSQGQGSTSVEIKSSVEPIDQSKEWPVIENDHSDASSESLEPTVPHATADASEPSPTLEDTFEGAGCVVGVTASVFAQIKNAMHAEGLSLHHPFKSEEEWELAAWMHESGISRSAMDRFLQLAYVKSRPPEFKNSARLIKNLGNLDYPGPQWKSQTIIPAHGTLAEPPTLFYRDPVDAIRYLFSRPSLAKDMDFAPKKVYADNEKTTRTYSEMSSADWWWQTQESLPAGSTIVPVILASDSTHLTQFSGGKKAWPVYLSIGNIRSEIRNTPSKHAWILIGYIPSVEFLDSDSIRGTLAARFYHQCMEVILNSMIEPGTDGTHIKDSDGLIRFCYLLVAAHIADMPESQLITLAPAKCSPVTTAKFHDLGNATPCSPRTREWVLSTIDSICDEVDPDNIKRYQKFAKRHGLTGVHRPFWRTLPRYQPEIVICPDLLHGGFKCWRDHLLLWARRLIGADEYDARLRCLQPVPYYRHFRSGIKHLSQWTGREDRELLRTHVAIIAGSPRIPPKVMQNQRAIADFLYVAQYQSHSDSTLQYLADAVSTFHNTKQVYITLGVRRGKRGVIKHFKILKLACLSNFANHITQMGSSPQFSTEISETLHRTLAKNLYGFTNRRNYVLQMCNRLERSERIAFQEEFLEWYRQEEEMARMISLFSMYTPRYRSIAISHHNRMLANSRDQRPREIAVPLRTRISQTRLWLTLKPHMPRQEVQVISAEYCLPDLSDKLRSYLHSHDPTVENDEDLDVSFLDVWTNLRIRTADVQDEDEVSQEHRIEAIPPSHILPHGRCHCVLVHFDNNAEKAGIQGYRVAQVRLLFRVYLRNTRSPLHGARLAYIQYFSKPKKAAERDILMYTVSRQDRGAIRSGSIIPMDSISWFVQLVPKFGPKAHAELTSDNSMDICRDYYVNSFADKQIYQSVW